MRLFRLLRILRVFTRYRLDRLLPAGSPWWLRLALMPCRIVPARHTPAASLRITLEELGPVFVKFGQILSTRRDLFSDEFASELEKLQDQVPPFPGEQAEALIEAQLGTPVGDAFAAFSREPLASASVAQVHTATLKTGEEVVVKVIRPGIDAVINKDLALMYLLAGMVERFWSEGRRLHPVEVVADYEHTILGELNLQIEASNTARLRENWYGSGKLYVPEIYWDYCGPSVMVMERIHGVMANDIKALKDNNVNLKKLAYLGVEIFFTQVFKDNFFHADMHPGNVFIDITDPENPTYIALDCAIIGTLTERDQTYLAKNLLAFFNEDYRAVAELHVESGWVPGDTNVNDFEAVIRSVCEPVFHKPIKEISFGTVLVNLFNTARQFNMEVQPQLVLLQKTLLNIEGMGRQIYDDLDLWETAAPFMEQWMDERIGVRRFLSSLAASTPRLIEKLPELPGLAVRVIDDFERLGSQVAQQTELMSALKDELAAQHRRSQRHRWGGLLILAAFIGVMLPQTGVAAGPELLLGSSIIGSLGFYWLFSHV